MSNRRRALLALLLFGTTTVSGAQAPAAAPDPLVTQRPIGDTGSAPAALPIQGAIQGAIQSAIHSAIEQRIRDLDGAMGVAAIDVKTGETLAVNADLRFPTASLIKVPVMVEVFHQIAAGKLQRDKLVMLREEDKAGDEPVVLNQLHAGVALTVRDLLALMIGYSDNTATNLLIREVGTSQVNDRMLKYGLEQTKLFRPTFRDGHADVLPELEREFGLGMTTPRDMARLLLLLAEGKLVSRAASDEMIALLDGQQFREMIPRSLPFARDHVKVANKTGWDEEKTVDADGRRGHIRTDAAYVRSDRARFVIAICARRVADEDWGVDNAAFRTGAAISREIYDYFARKY
jgi:beta-lactamase class A